MKTEHASTMNTPPIRRRWDESVMPADCLQLIMDFSGTLDGSLAATCNYTHILTKPPKFRRKMRIAQPLFDSPLKSRSSDCAPTVMDMMGRENDLDALEQDPNSVTSTDIQNIEREVIDIRVDMDITRRDMDRTIRGMQELRGSVDQMMQMMQ
jgi:hypothetical protein